MQVWPDLQRACFTLHERCPERARAPLLMSRRRLALAIAPPQEAIPYAYSVA